MLHRLSGITQKYIRIIEYKSSKKGAAVSFASLGGA
jgi:hypothetical protein